MPNPFEELGAKGAGAIKQVAAAIKGLHGVFNTLAKQHGEVAVLLERAKLSGDAEERLDLWAEIRVDLLSHEKGELEVVYPELRQHAELKAFAEEHEQEAGELEAAITELDGIDAASDLWHTKLEALAALVTRHVDEEEGLWFPEAAAHLSKEDTEQLDQRFLANQEAAAERYA